MTKSPPTGKTLPSLKSNFAWTFAGNAVYAAGQWTILALFAKLADAAMLGEYALAVALTAPVVMLSHLNLRSVLATDVDRQYSLGDYLAVRLGVSAAALVGICLLAVMSAESWRLAAAIVAVGAGQSAETVSDTFYGALQRRERLRQVAQSMIGRSVISVGLLGLTLWITGDLLWSVLALAAGRIGVLLVYDQQVGRESEDLSRTGGHAAWTVFRTALPLGFVLMLISLNTNVPRYAIEHHMGAPALGVFAAVVSFITVGSTMVNALGQTATSRLARHFADGELRRFFSIGARMALFVMALGVAGIVVAHFAGAAILQLIYSAAYARWQPLLVAVMGAGTVSYLAIFLGYAVTSARVFQAQMPLFGISALCCGVASWLLVPGQGLYGAVMAIALASLVQIAGQLYLLWRAASRRDKTL